MRAYWPDNEPAAVARQAQATRRSRSSSKIARQRMDFTLSPAAGFDLICTSRTSSEQHNEQYN
jgi:hypothetical protein